MFWNKKEEKNSLPELPPMKQDMRRDFFPPEDSSEMPEEELHGLPSFPDSPMKSGFSQSAIKDAVDNNEEDEIEIPSQNEEKNFRVVEMEDTRPKPMKSSLQVSPPAKAKLIPAKQPAPVSFPASPSIPEPSIPDFSPASLPPREEARSSDVFVKMDKFYSARKALLSAQNQMNNIDSLLKKIRETKMREEQELSAWEKEIMQAKSGIQEITKNIFEKA